MGGPLGEHFPSLRNDDEDMVLEDTKGKKQKKKTKFGEAEKGGEFLIYFRST